MRMKRQHQAQDKRPQSAAWLLLAVLFLPNSATLAQSADWPQWGGPQRNFKAPATGPETRLAATWPEAGPRRLWQRELGGGFSAIAAEGDKLFKVCRNGVTGVVIAQESSVCSTRRLARRCGNTPTPRRSGKNRTCRTGRGRMRRR